MPLLPRIERRRFISCLFECLNTTRVWQNLPLVSSIASPATLPFDILLQCVIKCLDRLEELVAVAWGLWQRRNTFIFDSKITPPLEAVNHDTLSFCADFKEASVKCPLQACPSDNGDHWNLVPGKSMLMGPSSHTNITLVQGSFSMTTKEKLLSQLLIQRCISQTLWKWSCCRFLGDYNFVFHLVYPQLQLNLIAY